ncbi:hypothetical protein C1H46_018743 [Malus baccata]|uniref:Uncharacterized protein n=1 Tax=Malus baccata TaxID=106549 RepID=A0A540MA13_MALBA|nr:hypothetical protein C1H46_018743 [Malus baccata]
MESKYSKTSPRENYGPKTKEKPKKKIQTTCDRHHCQKDTYRTSATNNRLKSSQTEPSKWIKRRLRHPSRSST